MCFTTLSLTFITAKSITMSPYSALLVASQFGLLLYLSLTGLMGTSMISWTFQALGIGVAIWGVLAMRIGQFNVQPEVRANVLVERGPNQWMRNPLDLGLFFVMIPSVIDHFSVLRLLALVFLSIVLLLKVWREEKLLGLHFGEAYDAYMKKTKRFLPFIF
jgi:protein-S-isoprenylcysteine O-methyltransferase Ste14